MTYDTPESTLYRTCETDLSKEQDSDSLGTPGIVSLGFGVSDAARPTSSVPAGMHVYDENTLVDPWKILTKRERCGDEHSTDALKAVGESAWIPPQRTTNVVIVFTITGAASTDTDAVTMLVEPHGWLQTRWTLTSRWKRTCWNRTRQNLRTTRAMILPTRQSIAWDRTTKILPLHNQEYRTHSKGLYMVRAAKARKSICTHL